MSAPVESPSAWWLGLDREAFYRRAREESARLHTLTNDPKLQARGPVERPKVGAGKRPDEGEV